MQKFMAIGRLTGNPTVRYTNGNEPVCIATFSLAVNRRFKRDGQPEADFFNCTAFRKTGELVEKYCHKGMKVAIEGELQNDNYTNKNGEKVYSTRILVDSLEFCENKSQDTQSTAPANQYAGSEDGFMQIPDSVAEELPFN